VSKRAIERRNRRIEAKMKERGEKKKIADVIEELEKILEEEIDQERVYLTPEKEPTNIIEIARKIHHDEEEYVRMCLEEEMFEAGIWGIKEVMRWIIDNSGMVGENISNWMIRRSRCNFEEIAKEEFIESLKDAECTAEDWKRHLLNMKNVDLTEVVEMVKDNQRAKDNLNSLLKDKKYKHLLAGDNINECTDE